MIYVYAKDATDFSTIGLVGALMPERCTYTESANGESRVEMLHPLDDSGKYKALEVGAILRLPVPVRNAPAIVEGNQTVTQVTHWRIKQDGNGQTAADRVLYADKGQILHPRRDRRGPYSDCWRGLWYRTGAHQLHGARPAFPHQERDQRA